MNGIHIDAKRADLHRYLYHGSEAAKSPLAKHHNEAMALCDGYGKLTVAELIRAGLTWDWSHVRDSSDEAISAAWQFLKDLGYIQTFVRHPNGLLWFEA
jgi:hypothetical protein